MSAEIVQKIRDFVGSLYTEYEISSLIDDIIPDYVDYEQMEEEGIEDEYDYYSSYGRGEAESEIHNKIIEEIALHINEPINDWYFNDKYGDIDEIIYEFYPQLNVL